MTKDLLRIGNAGGYWGDDPKALYRQVTGGPLDYITMDFLAEVTMSIMQKQRGRDASHGYAKDFIPMIESVLKDALEKRIRIITNAGGVNPEACAAAITDVAKKQGLSPRIAVVYGDDILPDLTRLRENGCAFTNMETGETFDNVDGRVLAANVYFGAAPVVEALKTDADIIITGRVTDTGITIAPMIHEFGWSLDDWDKLASGIVAGHILECGSQSTGGNFTDWHKVANFDDIGFPIAEVAPDGSFTITKHPKSGGMVTVDTVREQLFYEMGEPQAYLTPDVVCDFTTIQLQQDGPDRVRIFGVKGYEPTPLYKVSMAFGDGYKSIGDIAISGPNARAKAQKFAEIFWQRAGTSFAATSTEYFGWNAFHRSLSHEAEGNEIMLRLGVRDQDPAKLRTFGKHIPAVILAGPPGVCILGGVPRVQEVVSYWPALMPKSAIEPLVAVYNDGFENITKVTTTQTGNFEASSSSEQVATTPSAPPSTSQSGTTPLLEICLARSGDKGDTANIGLMARSPKAYNWIRENITSQVVKDLFQELCAGQVVRHELPNMLGLNFLLEHSLGGGGTMTLRSDAQGKTFAQALLRQCFDIPADVLGESS